MDKHFLLLKSILDLLLHFF